MDNNISSSKTAF